MRRPAEVRSRQMSGNGEWCSGPGRTILPMIPADSSTPPARYRALCSRDARFDGRFFVGVTSTGIYCRPICRVRTPKLENCHFFEHAAQAEQAGFRPCLRCRPELAPRQRHWSSTDATAILAENACSLLDDPARWEREPSGPSFIQGVAERLGISDRHLRRIFDAQLGVSPLQYLQTCRLLVAKQLLSDTPMPIADVARASGFGSLRRFNAAFAARYRMNPSLMRRHQAAPLLTHGSPVQVRLAWRPPLDVGWLMQFLKQRELASIERFQPSGTPSFFRTLRLQTAAGTGPSGWIRGHWDLDHNRLHLEVSDGLLKALPQVIQRVRGWLDLDADPALIHAALGPYFPDGEGLRVPGCLEGFELAVRAILGQQITVGAARTLLNRLVLRLGQTIASPDNEPCRLFPTPQALALVDHAVLGELGIVKQRQRAIKALAHAVLAGAIDLNPSPQAHEHLARMESLPGVGPWTTQYIGMRALRNPDAWPEGDAALHKMLSLPPPRNAVARREARELSESWRPWRSYAVLRAWAGFHVKTPF